MSELVKYEAACRAISEAASIDEAKGLRDQSEAMRAYARQAKNKDLETKAAEIRIRAERRIGELMLAQRDAGHMATAGRRSKEIGSSRDPINSAPTLDEVGVDKKLADRARKYAAIPEKEFDGIVDDWREGIEAENKRVTVNLLAAGEKAQKKPASGLSGLSREGLEEEVSGLRDENKELRSRVQKQRSEIAELKQHLKELTSADDAGRTIGNLQRRISHSEGRSKEHQANAARLQRQVKAQKEEIKRLTAQLENQVIPL